MALAGIRSRSPGPTRPIAARGKGDPLDAVAAAQAAPEAISGGAAVAEP
jgi:hypothetical protein